MLPVWLLDCGKFHQRIFKWAPCHFNLSSVLWIVEYLPSWNYGRFEVFRELPNDVQLTYTMYVEYVKYVDT